MQNTKFSMEKYFRDRSQFPSRRFAVSIREGGAQNLRILVLQTAITDLIFTNKFKLIN